ncbi:hypothetical protein EAE96_006862 [Botrytis aclada]|nr:hypothetical protein EAE96_006862 [Botrytis aclada]
MSQASGQSCSATGDADQMEKGVADTGIPKARLPVLLDPATMKPIKPEGMTQEEFEKTFDLPDENTERFCQYLQNLAKNGPLSNNLVRNVELSIDGYPRLATVIDSDEQFMLYRRFGHLQARFLLHKQDELRAQEERLFKLDAIYKRNDPERHRSRAQNNAKSKDHKNLLDSIEIKFREYAQLLTISRNLATLDRPTTMDYVRVRSYFDEQSPLCTSEQAYILRKEDLITLKPSRENTWLDGIVEKIPQKFPSRLTRHNFCPPELREKTNPDSTNLILFSPERVNIVVSVIILITILTLLVVPVYILWYLSSVPSSKSPIGILIGILLVFTLLFSAVLSLFTRAKRHEVLAAAAAYCAVLVVFVGNVGNLSPS